VKLQGINVLITTLHDCSLILGTSADSEKEEDIVEWLREVGMPADYVNRLARMFQDIKASSPQLRFYLPYPSKGDFN